jgi:hypothetical protein
MKALGLAAGLTLIGLPATADHPTTVYLMGFEPGTTAPSSGERAAFDEIPHIPGWMAQYPSYRCFVVEGHANGRDATDSMRLSAARVEVVRDLLVASGARPGRLIPTPLGQEPYRDGRGIEFPPKANDVVAVRPNRPDEPCPDQG